MQSQDLVAILAPFQMISSRSAMSPSYKTIQLTPDTLKAHSHYALLECYCDVGINDTAYLDTISFLNVMNSLPPSQEVKFSVESGVLSWSCGPARGKLATLPIVELPFFSELKADAAEVPATKTLADALDRASISCDNPALSAVGIYGVVLGNAPDRLIACSSDNFTISICEHPHVVGMPRRITLPPLGAELLGAVIDGTGTLYIDDHQDGRIIYTSDFVWCQVNGVPELKDDLIRSVYDYEEANQTSRIPPDRIAAFIKRVNALSDNRRFAKILMGAEEGHLTLQFDSGTASSEEYILADLDADLTIAPISLPAAKISRALSHVDEIVLDHVYRTDNRAGAIVLRGGAFRYMIVVTPK